MFAPEDAALIMEALFDIRAGIARTIELLEEDDDDEAEEEEEDT